MSKLSIFSNPKKMIEEFADEESEFKKKFRNFMDCVFLCILLCYAAQVYWYD